MAAIKERKKYPLVDKNLLSMPQPWQPTTDNQEEFFFAPLWIECGLYEGLRFRLIKLFSWKRDLLISPDSPGSREIAIEHMMVSKQDYWKDYRETSNITFSEIWLGRNFRHSQEFMLPYLNILIHTCGKKCKRFTVVGCKNWQKIQSHSQLSCNLPLQYLILVDFNI